MRHQIILALVCGSMAAPQRTNELPTRAEEPCAQVSAMVAPMRQANPNVVPSIPAGLAFSCLQSVPLHKEEAMGVVGSILPYVQFQSDLSFKRAPPAGYEYPPVDLVEAVTGVVRNLEANQYPNEYSWQADLFKTFNTARDGHFRYAGDLLARPIRFTRNVSLVSVSMDGVAVPQPYVLDDVRKMQIDASFKPSAITKINGRDATEAIQTEGDRGFQQDKDASYNTVMFSPAIDFDPQGNARGGFNGDGRAGFFYPGDNTTLTFANGSTTTYQTLARVPGNFTGVVDGESAFQKFCNPPPARAAAPPPMPTFRPGDPVTRNLTNKGFPRPQVIASDRTASGYYLTSERNKDVGVLSLPSFEPTTPAEMQAVIQTMLMEMQRDGKTKLIVDLQGNGGGIILNGFDAFRQLFPQTQDSMFARQRTSPAFNALAKISSDRSANFSANSDPDTINIAENHFNFRFDVDQNRQKFPSFESKFGPVPVNGDMMTNLQQWDFNDALLTTNETFGAGMTVTGYGSRTNFTQPFPASSIVMLYDGACASTCVLFSEMMRVQGNVKSIALGGRPTTTQIQAIGGVKGAQSLGFDGILNLAQFFVATQTNADPSLSALSGLPQKRGLDDGVNFSDQILKANVQDGLPAQFVREEADCRMFMTPAMVGSVTEMWEAAADVAFRGKACVVGGISQGMVAARQPVERRSMAEMKAAAADSRAWLVQVQTKAALQPVQRPAGWGDVHGRAIPNMHMS